MGIFNFRPKYCRVFRPCVQSQFRTIMSDVKLRVPNYINRHRMNRFNSLRARIRRSPKYIRQVRASNFRVWRYYLTAR